MPEKSGLVLFEYKMLGFAFSPVIDHCKEQPETLRTNFSDKFWTSSEQYVEVMSITIEF